VWINVIIGCQSPFIVFSIGSHGGAASGMYLISNDEASFEFLFWRQPGVVWRAEVGEVIVGRWHHIAVTWSEMSGLIIYVDGKRSAVAASPTQNETIGTLLSNKQWGLHNGNGNGNGNVSNGKCPVAVDDLSFRSKAASELDIKDLGK
jgi:hypothetical protein